MVFKLVYLVFSSVFWRVLVFKPFGHDFSQLTKFDKGLHHSQSGHRRHRHIGIPWPLAKGLRRSSYFMAGQVKHGETVC